MQEVIGFGMKKCYLLHSLGSKSFDGEWDIGKRKENIHTYLIKNFRPFVRQCITSGEVGTLNQVVELPIAQKLLKYQ